MGVIGRPHGVRGLVHVHSLHRRPRRPGAMAAAPTMTRPARKFAALARRRRGRSCAIVDGRAAPWPTAPRPKSSPICELYTPARDRLPAGAGRILPRRPHRPARVAEERRGPRPRRRRARLRRRHQPGNRRRPASRCWCRSPAPRAGGGYRRRPVTSCPPMKSPKTRRRSECGGRRMTWRATILTLFPACSPARSASPSPAARWSPASGRWMPRDIRDFAPTGTAAWTTPRSAAAPAWSCAPTCGRRHRRRAADGRPHSLPDPARPPLTPTRAKRLAAGPRRHAALRPLRRHRPARHRRPRREEISSIGDYVLSGGELAAMVLLDACIRLLPGVMGAAESATEESFAAGLLEYPHYTRPADLARAAPCRPVLLSGNHAAIAAWRRRTSRNHHPRTPPRSLGRPRARPKHRHERTLTMNIIQKYEADRSPASPPAPCPNSSPAIRCASP
jgi:tRNA (guanine37-N1)-methyltransferase